MRQRNGSTDLLEMSQMKGNKAFEVLARGWLTTTHGESPQLQTSTPTLGCGLSCKETDGKTEPPPQGNQVLVGKREDPFRLSLGDGGGEGLLGEKKWQRRLCKVSKEAARSLGSCSAGPLIGTRVRPEDKEGQAAGPYLHKRSFPLNREPPGEALTHHCAALNMEHGERNESPYWQMHQVCVQVKAQQCSDTMGSKWDCLQVHKWACAPWLGEWH